MIDAMTVAMSEGRRQAYLAALGIPLWTARANGPLAGQSAPVRFVAYELEQEADVVDIEAEVQPLAVFPLASAPASPSASVKPLASAVPEQDDADYAPPPVYDDEPPLEAYLDDPEYQQAQVIDSVRKFAEPAQSPTPVLPALVKPAASVEQPINFRFGVYPCGLWQLIVPRSQLLSPSEAQLLNNIQRVLQKEQAAPLLFSWPMVNNYAIPRHKRAAREALEAFFKNQALTDKGYIVLADHEDELVELLKQSTAKPVLSHPGLSFLLQQPALKKALWLALNQ